MGLFDFIAYVFGVYEDKSMQGHVHKGEDMQGHHRAKEEHKRAETPVHDIYKHPRGLRNPERIVDMYLQIKRHADSLPECNDDTSLDVITDKLINEIHKLNTDSESIRVLGKTDLIECIGDLLRQSEGNMEVDERKVEIKKVINYVRDAFAARIGKDMLDSSKQTDESLKIFAAKDVGKRYLESIGL